MIPELPADVYAVIGAKLPVRDHVRFVAATRKHVSEGGLSPDHYAASVATHDALVGALLHSKTGPDKRLLVQEALFATRSRADLGVDAHHSPATNGARLQARRFFDSLKRSDVFAFIAAHAQSDPQLWSMLRSAWTRRTPTVAAHELRRLAPTLSSAEYTDLAELNGLAQELEKMTPGQLTEQVRKNLGTIYAVTGPESPAAPAKPREYSLLFARELLRRGDTRRAQVVLHGMLPEPEGREHLRVLRDIAARSDGRFDKQWAIWEQFQRIPELKVDPELQKHEFLRLHNEIAENKYFIFSDERQYTYMNILGSLADRDIQKSALNDRLEEMRGDVHLPGIIRSIKDPGLRALADAWQRSRRSSAS